MTATFNGTDGELVETGLARIPLNFVTKRTTYSLMRTTARDDVFTVLDKSNRAVGHMQIRNGAASQIFGNEVSNDR